jgi:hypothetical protein
MASKVLVVDVTSIAKFIVGLNEYQQVFLLFCYRNLHVGKATLPVINGGLSQFDL